MFMIQCYALFWLFVTGSSLKMLMDRLNNDNEEEQQEQREEIESMGKFFSGAYIGRMFFIVGALLLLIDCVG
ncbi:MAG: hypothetical protein II089_12495, partial [Selenomonas sp.]|nr:hypothetical protein [Selenomonas sp.]